MTVADRTRALTALEGLAEPMPGLVFAHGFDEAGHAHVLSDREAIVEALAGRDGWVWLHFNLADVRAGEWIGHSTLPETARDLLLDPDDHLRLAAEDEALFGVFADFRREDRKSVV